MFEISKEFSFDYGHRVHTQKLIQSHSIDTQCACRHLHGHRGTIKVILIGEELEKETQMLTDFKHLNWLGKFIDENLDHKMILDLSDPLIESGMFPEIMRVNRLLKPNQLELSWSTLKEVERSGSFKIEEEVYSSFAGEYKELYEGLVFVEFCPTSENLAKWIYGMVKDKMSQFLNIASLKIQFSETPKSTAVYYE